ncbi:hypothetical protein M6D93_17695 [Jatrophihabitans telluris]|uniref:Uncharacterized protein n=1 Tax=Jatrophihabitans telluris TaxID=2038343 RepID=A0ABY4QWQ7_9ACTN|nr:hypothetical protein [Jatrophihabitans telluris]UQX88106.1 hypothetical protein M6D93_17695 [Jatrophihabitans telluris]
MSPHLDRLLARGPAPDDAALRPRTPSLFEPGQRLRSPGEPGTPSVPGGWEPRAPGGPASGDATEAGDATDAGDAAGGGPLAGMWSVSGTATGLSLHRAAAEPGSRADADGDRRSPQNQSGGRSRSSEAGRRAIDLAGSAPGRGSNGWPDRHGTDASAFGAVTATGRGAGILPNRLSDAGAAVVPDLVSDLVSDSVSDVVPTAVSDALARALPAAVSGALAATDAGARRPGPAERGSGSSPRGAAHVHSSAQADPSTATSTTGLDPGGSDQAVSFGTGYGARSGRLARRSQPAEPTTVEVTIARVDVRLDAAGVGRPGADPSARSSRPRPRQAIRLQDYLARRESGDHR